MSAVGSVLHIFGFQLKTFVQTQERLPSFSRFLHALVSVKEDPSTSAMQNRNQFVLMMCSGQLSVCCSSDEDHSSIFIFVQSVDCFFAFLESFTRGSIVYIYLFFPPLVFMYLFSFPSSLLLSWEYVHKSINTYIKIYKYIFHWNRRILFLFGFIFADG